MFWTIFFAVLCALICKDLLEGVAVAVMERAQHWDVYDFVKFLLVAGIIIALPIAFFFFPTWTWAVLKSLLNQ